MKFALYMEPHQIFHSSFYTYQLLQELFNSKNHILDFYTPIDYNIDSLEEPNNKINIKNLKDIYNIEFQIKFPAVDDYDVLLLEPHYYKNWSNIKTDMRCLIASRFKDKNKLVIVLNSSMLMETRLIKLDNIYYGIKSSRILALENINKYKLSYFFMPSVSYLINPKPDHLSQQQFYQKYKLDPNKRIIAFLPGKLCKWRKKETYQDNLFNNKLVNNNFFQNNKQIHWFKENCQKIIDIFNGLGYQLVGKMHIRDFEKFSQEDKSGRILMKSNITYIQQYDTYELLKYSSYALTFGSTMVYQLYLYNIPSIEIGTGFYFPGWAYPTTTHDNFYMKLVKKYNNGKDLIYGNVIDFDKIQEDPHKHIVSLLSNITNFKHRINNPIYGKTYGHTIDDVYKGIIKISTLEKLKSTYLSS